MLKINDKISIPSDEITLSYTRSSGPGGQNVNKVSSKVIFEWDLSNSAALPDRVKQRFIERFQNRINQQGILLIQSDRFRDRLKNIKDCEDKLRAMLLECIPEPKQRKATKPKKQAVEKRLQSKRATSEKKKNRQKVSY